VYTWAGYAERVVRDCRVNSNGDKGVSGRGEVRKP
jgi:hypothetical protein